MKLKITKKQWWLGVILLCVIALAGICVWNYVNRPQNIGPKLEYIGEANFGCSWVEGLLTFELCGDRDTNHMYIYATNMDQAEFKAYFTKATIVDTQPNTDCVSSCTKTGIWLWLRKGEATAMINYYFDGQGYLAKGGLDTMNIKTSKPHIVEIPRVDYQLVKSSY